MFPNKSSYIRQFSSISNVVLNRSKKTLAQKLLQSSSTTKAAKSEILQHLNLDYKRSTSLYFNWLFNNPKKLLTKYEDSLLNSLKLSESVKFSKGTVAGLHQLYFRNESKNKDLDPQISTPTVLIHGFAASGVFYHRNFPELTSKFTHLYTLDMPSVGLSDSFDLKDVQRIKYDFKLDSKTGEYQITWKDKAKAKESIAKVEDYYVERIEQWRIANKIERFNLVSHSFGGLISSKYCQKYPERVAKLALISPVGVEKSVFSINNSTISGFVQSSHPQLETYYKPSLIPSMILKFGFSITKIMGPFGINLISRYLSMRYARNSTNVQQIDDFIHYTIILFYQRSNSLRNLTTLLNNRLLALNPIMDSVDKLQMPLLFMYGQYDWMNSKAGYLAAMKVNQKTLNSTTTSGVVKDQAQFKIIPNSGHNVFLDNPVAFNEEIVEFLKE
ncbi:hypothetical protein WICPIJ_006262 [Wickerhamomyces pijperi]|uniref:AB hydrolase-1 domain-containing protein n=1 Tax=Wickerhamomyces pijperi TaxID=599730 RepID=A0A9P8TKE3_WICPI|nr:hypothetical protein WICPIJ_006262 [Wickerhamomyces pijperi]